MYVIRKAKKKITMIVIMSMLLSLVNLSAFSPSQIQVVQAANTVLFSDTFEDGNVTDWTVVEDGPWAVVTDSVSGSQVYSQTDTTSTSYGSFVTAGDATWTDYIVSADVRKTAYHNVGITGRVTSNTQYYVLRTASNTGEWKLEKVDGPNSNYWTVLASGTYSWGNSSTWYNLKMEFKDNTISAYINNVLLTTITDTSATPFTSGKIGLKTATSAANYDNVLVEAPATADTTAPTAPTGVTAAGVSETQIDLSWTASTDDVGVSSYSIYRDNVAVGTSATASYSDTGLTAATTYSYTITATDAAGNVSAASTAVSGTTNSPVAPPAFSDNFEIDASKWTIVQGTTWTLATDNGSQVYSQSTANDPHMGSSLVTAGDPTWDNYTVSADVRKLSYHRAGIVGRISGTNKFYELFVATNYDPDQWQLVKVDGSSNTVILSGAFSPNLTSTDYYNFKMKFDLSTISVYIDNVLLGSVTDTSYTAGHIGLRTNPSGANFDNVLVEGPSSTDTTAPSAPTGVTASVISASQIDLSWTASTDDVGVSSYTIYRDNVAVGTSTTTSYSDTGLTASTTYSYTITASDAAGNVSAASTAVSATTSASADTQAPTVPTGLTASAVSSSQINLSWTASTDNVGVTAYTIYRNNVAVGTSTTTSYSDAGLAASTTYSYTVTAKDAAGNESAASTAASATTTANTSDTAAPSAPTGVTATTVSNTQIDLSWTASTDNVGVALYRIYRNGVEIGTSTTTSYSSTFLAGGTTYNYEIKAKDAAGNSSDTSVLVSGTTPTSTTDVTIPSTPTMDDASIQAVSPTQLDITWFVSTDDVGVTGYIIYRDDVEVGTSTTNTFSDTGLAAETTYSYRIQATDAAGNRSNKSYIYGKPTLVATDWSALDGLVELNYYINETNARIIYHIGHNFAIPASLKARAVVDMPNGTPDLLYEQAITSAGEKSISIPLSAIPVGNGKYPVEISILDGSTEIWSNLDTLVRKPAPATLRRITQTDRNREIMLVDGQPFFSIGVFGTNVANLDDIAAAGFNMTMRWKGETTHNRYNRSLPSTDIYNVKAVRDYLDAVQAAGLYALESPVKLAEQALYVKYHDPEFNTKYPIVNGEVMPGVVANAMDHPVVIGYYSYDEPDNVYGCCPGHEKYLSMEEGVEDYYTKLKAIDPYHSVMALFAVGLNKVDLQTWGTEAWDVAAKDYYPTESTHLSSVYNDAKKSANASSKWRTPYVHTPMLEDSSSRAKPLNGPEQRAQTYLSLIGGAKGIFWWEWPAVYSGNWQMISKLAGEMNELAPILVERDPAQVISYVTAGTENNVKAVVKNYNGKTYIIAANAEYAPLDVTFTLPTSYTSAALKFENGRTVSITSGTFKDSFESHGRHVYELVGEWPAGATLSMNITNVGLSEKTPDPAPQTLERNLNVNGSFETDYGTLPGWPFMYSVHDSVLDAGEADGSLDSRWRTDADITNVLHGNRSMRLVKLLAGKAKDYEANYFGHAPQIFQNVYYPSDGLVFNAEGKATRSYTMSLYMKADAPDTTVWVTAGGITQTILVGSDWNRESVTFDLTFNKTDVDKPTYRKTSSYRISLMDQGTLWIDAVQVELGTSATSYEDPDFAPIDETPPSAPVVTTAATVDYQIDLSWPASTDNVGVEGYKVFRDGVQIATTTNTSYNDTGFYGLPVSTTYTYTVEAFDRVNNSAISAPVTGTTLPDTENPHTPKNIRAFAISDTEINLTWVAVYDNVDPVEYIVYRNNVEVGRPKMGVFTDKNLTPGTTYTYTVETYDLANNFSGLSNPAIATTGATGMKYQGMEGIVDRNYYTTAFDVNANIIYRVGYQGVVGTWTAKAVVDFADATADKTYQATISNTGDTIISIPLSEIPLGAHRVTMSILNGTTVIWQGENILEEKAAPTDLVNTRVTQNNRSNNTMVVDGAPFFPIGVFGTNFDNLGTIKANGFNMTMRWKDNTTKNRYDRSLPSNDPYNQNAVQEYLNAVNAAGLYAMEIPVKLIEEDMYVLYKDRKFDEKWPLIHDQILPGIMDNTKNHPAVIGYYSYDEPDNFNEDFGPTDPNYVLMQRGVEDYYRTAKQLDPYHNILALFASGVSKNQDWNGWDMLARDKYASETETMYKIYQTSKDDSDLSDVLKVPFIMTPLFENSDGRKYPMSGAEQRSSTYMSLIGGAKGIFWWEWPAVSVDNWNMIVKIADEINQLKPILLERPPVQQINYADATMVDTVKAIIKNYNGKSYLITASGQKAPTDVTFTLPAAITGGIVKFEGDRIISIVDNKFTDTFEPYGRHVYELTGTWAEGDVLTMNVTVGTAPAGVEDPLFPALEGNYVINSSFEEDYGRVPGWPYAWSTAESIHDSGTIGDGAINSRWTPVTDTWYHGTRSLRMIKEVAGIVPDSWYVWYNADAPSAHISVQNITTTGKHTMSVYLKADAPRRIWLMVGWGNVIGDTEDEYITVTTEWQRYSITVDQSSSSTFLRVILVEQGTLWVDAVQFEPGEVATEYKYAIPVDEITPPSTPTNLSATVASSSEIDLSWTASTDNVAVTGYKIYRDAVEVGTSTTNTFHDVGLSTGVTYTYTVKAYDAVGNISAASEPYTFEIDLTAPQPITDLTAVGISGSRADLNWTIPADDIGVTGYIIYRDTVEIARTTTNYYQDSYLTPQTSYNYTVKSHDKANNISADSNIATATTTIATEYLEDDFENRGVTWTYVKGTTWTIATDTETGSQVLSQPTTDGQMGQSVAVAGDATWQNYSVSVDVKKFVYHHAGIIGRVSADHTQYYELYLATNADNTVGSKGKWVLDKINGSTTTNIASGDFPVTNNGNGVYYNLKMSFVNSTIEVYIDDVFMGSGTDASYIAGKVGVRTNPSAANFDNVLVKIQ